MEKYFPVVAKQKLKEKEPLIIDDRSKGSVAPISQATSSKTRQLRGVCTLLKDSSDITNALLTSLSDASNPITHSNIADRSDHYVAFATGHQVADERVNQRLYLEHREEKLLVQRGKVGECGILKNVRVYIDGYLESTTDIEMKRLVVEAGGQIVPIASQCTHIVTSRCLSGSKSHRLLTQKRSKIHVVKPEWVLDSLALGKRRPERTYAIVKHNSSLEDFLKP